MKSLYKLTILVISLFMIYSTETLYGFSYSECKGHNLVWKHNRTTMSIDTNSFPSNSEWDRRLQSAMWHWNNVKGSNFEFYYNYTTSHRLNNGENEIFWSDSQDLGEDTLARTFWRYKCYKPWYSLNWRVKLTEADIVFN